MDRLATLLVFVLVLRIVLTGGPAAAWRRRLGPGLGRVRALVLAATEPLVAPFRRLAPQVGLGFDFSPLVAIIAVDLAGRLLTYVLLRGG